jgi:hypothetical protein
MAMVAPQGRRNDDDDDSMRIRDLWTPSVKVALRNGPMVELAPQQQLNLSVKRDARQARSYSRKLKTLKERYRRSIDVEDPAKGERAKTKDEKVSAFFRVAEDRLENIMFSLALFANVPTPASRPPTASTNKYLSRASLVAIFMLCTQGWEGPISTSKRLNTVISNLVGGIFCHFLPNLWGFEQL